MKRIIQFFTTRICLYLLCCLSPVIAMAQPTTGNKKAVGIAHYAGINQGQYLKSWWIAGPFTLDSSTGHTIEAQEKFFNEDLVTSINIGRGEEPAAIQLKGKEFKWQPYLTKTNIIDFDSVFKKADYATGYALAEVMADSSYTALMAVGSDDGIKIWHNGKPVHTNWIARGIVPDNDVVAIPLVKGNNQILMKVQDMQGGWGFTARFLDKAAISKKLIDAAAKGNMDDINMLLNAGAGLNEKDASGLTAVTSAKLHGRDDIVKLLLQKGAADAPLPAPDAMLDGLYSSLKGKPAAGIAILVSKDGKVLYKKGFGYADIEKKVPVSTDTKFRIGSVTKQFIATAILKLQEEGRLNVTDKLSKYVPGFPKGDQITLHHLLTHTSGIHSYTSNDDFITKVVKPINPDTLIHNIQKDSFDFNPGEKWKYNNSGYFLLGYIIEKVSGKSYGQYLKEAIFDPLQMKNTGVHSSDLKLTNEAKGYGFESDLYSKTVNWDMSWAGGAGSLYSTVEDLFKWNEAIFGGKVLSEKSLKAAFTPVVLNNGKKPEGVEYGYGWGTGKYRGLDVIQHSGGLHGFLTQNARYPSENLSVTVLTNVTPPQVTIDPGTIAEFYLAGKMEKQQSYSVQAAIPVDVKLYEGRYDFGNGVMNITSDGKNLFAQLSGQGKFPIFPSAPDEFFWKVVEARIKFIKNEKGEVTSGQFFQGGAEINAAKLKDEPIVAVDAAIYKDYTGDYTYGDMIISVTTDKEKIFARATGEQQYEIFPLSETTFLVKELNAKLHFVRESDNKVGKLIVEMGGQKKDAPRVKK